MIAGLVLGAALVAGSSAHISDCVGCPPDPVRCACLPVRCHGITIQAHSPVALLRYGFGVRPSIER
jgi:hypothetical protein